jgi:hypothetical protein
MTSRQFKVRIYGALLGMVALVALLIYAAEGPHWRPSPRIVTIKAQQAHARPVDAPRLAAKSTGKVVTVTGYVVLREKKEKWATLADRIPQVGVSSLENSYFQIQQAALTPTTLTYCRFSSENVFDRILLGARLTVKGTVMADSNSDMLKLDNVTIISPPQP